MMVFNPTPRPNKAGFLGAGQNHWLNIMVKHNLADIMRELTASAQFRKCKSEMLKLQRSFSNTRYVMIFNPSEQTLEMLENEGFTVERTKIKEFIQYKVSW